MVIEMGVTKFNFLHISDLHFGKSSISKDAFGTQAFDDFFSLIEDDFSKIIEEREIKCLIISGDIISRGEEFEFQNEYLIKFLRIFNEKNVPVLICNGNHDLQRNSIIEKRQFEGYKDFMKTNKKLLNIEYSDNFENNQAAFLFLEQYNLLFLSLNSCKYIENKIISEELKKLPEFSLDPDKYLQKRYLNVGILSRRDLTNIFKELRRKFGEERLNYTNIFVICHHSIGDLEESDLSINFLKVNKVKIIFSGHLHKNKAVVRKDLDLINFIAGSFLSDINARTNDVDLKVNPPQFNLYTLDFENKTITPVVYKYRDDSRWKGEELPKETINFMISYHSIEDWCDKYGCNSIIYELERRDINLIIENTEDEYDFVMVNSADNQIPVWLIRDNDTQEKVDFLKKWIVVHFEKLNNGWQILIIKKTTKFERQFPDRFLIEVDNDM
ncbi:MAG: metallophosphoesterase family protein [Candidatus Helarchaeota archaeon]